MDLRGRARPASGVAEAGQAGRTAPPRYSPNTSRIALQTSPIEPPAPGASLDRRQQVAVAAGDVEARVEAPVELGLVAVLLERLEPLQLTGLRLGVDLEDVDVVDHVGDVLVDPDDYVLSGAVALVVGGGDSSISRCMNSSAFTEPPRLLDLLHQLPGALLDLVGERLDEVGAGEGIDRVGDARLVGEHLLGAERDPSARSAGRAPRRSRWCEATGSHRRPRRSPGRDPDDHLGLLGLE